MRQFVSMKEASLKAERDATTLDRQPPATDIVVGGDKKGGALQCWRTVARCAVLLSASVMMACMHRSLPESPVSAAAYDRSLERAEQAVLARGAADAGEAVTVQARQGIVILAGTVTTLLERDRIAAMAESVRGARAVVNLIEVAAEHPVADDALGEEVRAALRANPATRSEVLSVVVRGGAVTLYGHVKSATQAEVAQRVAAGVEGVRVVSSQLAIDVSRGQGDAQLEAEIETRLRSDAWLNRELVRAHVHDGRVALVGAVGRASERNRAISDAWVLGITDVDASGLRVEGWLREPNQRASSVVPAISAKAIEDAVRLALFYDPRVHDQAISIESDGSRVVLGGKVSNRAAAFAAVADARSVLGVTHVKDELTLNEAPPTGVLERPGATRQDSLEPDLEVSTARAIVRARCEQQERCGLLGERGQYPTWDACLSTISKHEQGALSGLSCSTRDDDRTLLDCLSQVRTADCARPFSLADAPACSGARLCGFTR